MERHHCTHRCFTDPWCWGLSYHFENQPCSFGAEQCAIAYVNEDFLLLIYPKSLKEQFATLIAPFIVPEYKHFSKRLVEIYPHHSRHYASGQMIICSDAHLVGIVATPSAASVATFSDDKGIANALNSYFCGIGQKLLSKFPNTDQSFTNYLLANTTENFFSAAGHCSWN